MLCKSQLRIGNRYVPCGQCIHCRINKQREWAGRILLEAKYTADPSAFVTLTYAPEHLPEGGTLVRDHPREFINRLRKDIRSHHGRNLRFFTVGEYGDKYGRPHYHLVLFGVDPSRWEARIQHHWRMGHTHVGEVTTASAQYVAHYTTKKLTKDSTTAAGYFSYLPGVQSEFAQMSRLPPIGAPGAQHLVELYRTRTGSRALQDRRLAYTFEYAGKRWPIGRYWREWITRQLGREPDRLPDVPNYVDLPIIKRSQFDGRKAEKQTLEKISRRKRAKTF